MRSHRNKDLCRIGSRLQVQQVCLVRQLARGHKTIFVLVHRLERFPSIVKEKQVLEELPRLFPAQAVAVPVRSFVRHTASVCVVKLRECQRNRGRCFSPIDSAIVVLIDGIKECFTLIVTCFATGSETFKIDTPCSGFLFRKHTCNDTLCEFDNVKLAISIGINRCKERLPLEACAENSVTLGSICGKILSYFSFA